VDAEPGFLQGVAVVTEEAAQDRWNRRLSTATIAIAVLSLISAAVAIAQWSIANGTLTELRDEQRPWVGGTMQVFFNPAPPNPPSTSYYFLDVKNTGRTPALGISITLAEWATDPATASFPLRRCEGSTCRMQNIELLPGGDLALRIPEGGKPEPKLDDVGHVIARIDYKEPNGKGHRTDICFTVVFTPLAIASGAKFSETMTACPQSDSNYAD
jgi:hypothetical protein